MQDVPPGPVPSRRRRVVRPGRRGLADNLSEVLRSADGGCAQPGPSNRIFVAYAGTIERLHRAQATLSRSTELIALSREALARSAVLLSGIGVPGVRGVPRVPGVQVPGLEEPGVEVLDAEVREAGGAEGGSGR